MRVRGRTLLVRFWLLDILWCCMLRLLPAALFTCRRTVRLYVPEVLLDGFVTRLVAVAPAAKLMLLLATRIAVSGVLTLVDGQRGTTRY